MHYKQKLKWLTGVAFACLGCLWTTPSQETIEASRLGATHIGTFEGSTTFTTSSSNGINPGLFIEVMDDDGNLTQYESEEGVITIPNTKEGAYVTQAKLLGKTKYRDQDTNELLDVWEEGRDLKLESVQSPVLTTSGKNLFNDALLNGKQRYEDGKYVVDVPTSVVSKDNQFAIVKGFKPKTAYTFMATIESSNWVNLQIVYKDGSNFVLGGWGNGTNVRTSDGNKTIDYISFTSGSSFEISDIFLGEARSEETVFEPYQSNILTTEQDLELRGIDKTRDTLDLMTGQFTQKVGEMTIDGSEGWVVDPNYRNETTTKIYVSNYFSDKGYQGYTDVMAETLPYVPYETIQSPTTSYPCISNSTVGSLNIRLSKLQDESVAFVKSYLKANNIKVQAKLTTSVTKRVGVKSTYKFPLTSNIQVDGNISPIITSIAVPTDELSFVLNPNQEAGQQFIAPEFEVSNNSNAPLSLTLRIFEQTTDVLNDVLPSEHDSWDGLTKEQSKDIALGLVTQPSDDWLNRIEKTHYVSETNNNLLGTIKPKGTVGFEFIAHHGQAFDEILNPSYRLTFVFDLLR